MAAAAAAAAGAAAAEAAAARRTAPASTATPAWHVLDVLDGLFRLEKRSPTLDGSAPLRTAQGCDPFLAGNAYGTQLTLARPLRLARRFGRWQASWDEGGEALERLLRARLPWLVESGYLTRAWATALREGVARVRAGDRLCLFTGLLVRPESGLALHLTNGANRRNRLVEVSERLFGSGELVPVVLDLALSEEARAPFRLMGELATLAPLRPGVAVRESEIESAPEMAEAHSRFYDASYFATKKGEITGRYRREVLGQAAAPPAPDGTLTIAAAGSRLPAEPLESFTTAKGPEPVRRPGRGVARAVFRNLVALSAVFDGQTLSVDIDGARLKPMAEELRRRWERLLPEELRRHPGALLYLTKYVTPHVPGEPHFFVKPWAFLGTSPGWSCLLEGIHGPGYDVLRGVVHTDHFHAVPAVFALHRVGEAVRIAEGAPLLHVVPVPRELLAAPYAAVSADGMPG